MGGVAIDASAAGAASTGSAQMAERLRAAKVAPFSRVTATAATAAGAAASGGPGAETLEAALEATPTARRNGRAATLRLSAAPVPGRADAFDLIAAVRARGRGQVVEQVVGVRLGEWSRDAYLALPGPCYAGNRFQSRHVAYPPLLTEPADIGPHVPPIVSDIPRLNVREGPSALAASTADLAIPAVVAFLPAIGLGSSCSAIPARAARRPAGRWWRARAASSWRSRCAPRSRPSTRGPAPCPPASPERRAR